MARFCTLILWLVAAAWFTLRVEDPGNSRLIFGCWTIMTFLVGTMAIAAAWLATARLFSRSAMMKTAVAYFSVGIFWAGSEAAGLLGWIRYDRLFAPEPLSALGSRPEPSVVHIGETREDIAAHWGVPGKRIPFDYRTNALGFRNLPERTRGDIVLLGDSIVVAALVPYEATIAARLEAETGHTTMNMALIGESPADEQEWFRSAGLDPGGSVVLQFLFEGNDLLDTRADRMPRSELVPSRLERSLTWNFCMTLQRLTQPVAGVARRRVGTIAGESYAFLWPLQGDDSYTAERAEIQRSVADFSTEIQRRGGQYALVFVPMKLRVLGPLAEFPTDSELRDYARHLDDFREATAAWAAQIGLAFFDLTPALERAAREGRIPWFRWDTHLNSIGCEVVAQALAEWHWLASATSSTSR